MNNLAKKIDKGCTVGVFAGIVGLIGAAGIGGVGSYTDYANSLKLHSDVRSIATSIEQSIVVSGPEAFEMQVASLPNVNYETGDKNTTIKVAGTSSGGYCITATNPDIKSNTDGIQYFSKSSTGKSTGKNVCDMDTSNAVTKVDGGPLTSGLNLSEYTDETTAGAVATLMVSIFSGVTNQAISRRRRGDLADETDAPTITKEAVRSPQPVTGKSPKEVTFLMEKVAAIKADWFSYEMDLVKLLSYPSVTNMGFPATSDFHQSLKHVNYLATLDKVKDGESTGEFRLAVLDLEHKFDVMIAEAKRSKWKNYDKKEQDSLRVAQSLLAIAVDSASSPNERQIAYKRLIKEVEGILVLPEKAILELESKVSLSIDASKFDSVQNVTI